MADPASIKERLSVLDNERSHLQKQLENQEMAYLVSRLTKCDLYVLYHYYIPSNFNKGDYETTDIYYIKPPGNCDTTRVCVTLEELKRIKNKIQFN